MTPLKQLDDLARDLVGDGGSPDLFFVSNEKGVFLVTTDFDIAHDAWDKLPTNKESALEDRKIGTIACTQPVDDESTQLISTDDTYTFRKELGLAED